MPLANWFPSEKSELENAGFPDRKQSLFRLSRKSSVCAEAYAAYVAQANVRIDTEKREKGNFRTGTNWIIPPRNQLEISPSLQRTKRLRTAADPRLASRIEESKLLADRQRDIAAAVCCRFAHHCRYTE